MSPTDIIEALRSGLAQPGGRHLYGVVGSYAALDSFAVTLRAATQVDGTPFPEPIAVNAGLLDAIPDDEFRQLVTDEAKRPQPVAKHIERAFAEFLRAKLGNGLIVLDHLELLFIYQVDLGLLRTLGADDNRFLLLLPGRRVGGQVQLFSEDEPNYRLPINLIAANHLWEL